MNFHEPFYAAIAAMLEVNGKGAAVDYCMAASDYVEQLRRGQVDSPAAEVDLLDSILARAIELAIRSMENYDSYIHILSKCNPEQYIYSLVTIVSSAPIPQNQNAYRQVLIAIENLFDHNMSNTPLSQSLFNVLLGMINVHGIAMTYSTFAGYDSRLPDRIIHKLSAL
jgi:hypothetical protein